MSKQMITTTYFNQTMNYADVDKSGDLYLEKRPKGKWLCYKKGNIIKVVKLTKKSFQCLNKFTDGVRIQKYVEMNENIHDEYNDEYCDMWYGKNCLALPMIVSKPKERAAFVIQTFIFKSS